MTSFSSNDPRSGDPLFTREGAGLSAGWYAATAMPAHNVARLAKLVELEYREENLDFARPPEGQLPSAADVHLPNAEQSVELASRVLKTFAQKPGEQDYRAAFEGRIDTLMAVMTGESRRIEAYLIKLKTLLKAAGLDSDAVTGQLRSLTQPQAELFAEFQRPDNPLFLQMRGVFRSVEPLAAVPHHPSFIGDCGGDLREIDWRVKRIRQKVLRRFREGISGFTDEGHFCESARNTDRKGNAYVISLVLGEYDQGRDQFRAIPKGASLFGHMVDHLFLEAPVARAHRERIVLLADTLSARLSAQNTDTERMVIRSVACGNARDIELVLRRPGNIKKLFGVDIRLEDIDLEALREAQDTLLAAARYAQEIQWFSAGPNISIRQFNLVTDLIGHYLEEGAASGKPPRLKLMNLPSQHFATTTLLAGILDYFDDLHSAVAMMALYHQLPDKGDLLATFVDGRNPDRGIQELLLGWRLVYRGKEEIRNLMQQFSRAVERANEDAQSAVPGGGPLLGFSGIERTDILTAGDLHAAMGEGPNPRNLPPLAGGEWAVVPTPNGMNWMLIIRKNWVGTARDLGAPSS